MLTIIFYFKIRNNCRHSFYFIIIIIMFLVFTLLLIYIRGGTISSPSGVTSIWNSVANAAVEAKYIFSFVLETYLSTNS